MSLIEVYAAVQNESNIIKIGCISFPISDTSRNEESIRINSDISTINRLSEFVRLVNVQSGSHRYFVNILSENLLIEIRQPKLKPYIDHSTVEFFEIINDKNVVLPKGGILNLYKTVLPID